MAYVSLTSEEVEAGKPVKTSLMDTIRTNMDDLDSRVSGLSATGNVSIFNQILKMPEIPIGAAIWSWDTLANSQQQGLGTNWVRAEGSGAGTWLDGGASSHNVPDARNKFLRMASTYTSVNVTGDQADSTAVNGLSGSANSAGAHVHSVGSSVNYNGSGSGYTGGSTGDKTAYNTSSNGSHGHSLSLSGDSETRPVNIQQTLLFKKEYAYGERKLLFKAAYAMTINNTILTQLEAGGNTTDVEIDVKVGTIANLRADTMTSIFTTKPIVTSDGSTDFVEDSGTINDGSVAAGEYIELSVTSYQSGMSEIFIQVSGLS